MGWDTNGIKFQAKIKNLSGPKTELTIHDIDELDEIASVWQALLSCVSGFFSCGTWQPYLAKYP